VPDGRALSAREHHGELARQVVLAGRAGWKESPRALRRSRHSSGIIAREENRERGEAPRRLGSVEVEGDRRDQADAGEPTVSSSRGFVDVPGMARPDVMTDASLSRT